MIGWRPDNEDAHIADLHINRKLKLDCNELSIFGVFDGHGSKYVSKFCSSFYTKELIQEKDLLTDTENVLINHNFQLDDCIKTPKGMEIIKAIAKDEDFSTDIDFKKEVLLSKDKEKNYLNKI